MAETDEMTVRARVIPPKSEQVTGKAGVDSQPVGASREAVQQSVEQAIAMTRENFEKANQQAFRGYDELTRLSKENVDAVVEASTILARTAETVGKSVLALSKSSLEISLNTGKEMLGVRTWRELVDVQTEFAKANFDNLMAEATRLSELTVKAANQAIEPIQARLHATLDRTARPVAA